jgi:hypothetical protein
LRSAHPFLLKFCATAISFVAGSLRAVTNAEAPGEQVVLSPPYTEVPLSFQERYGLWLGIGALLLFALVLLAAWWRWRPRPKILLPADLQARQELEALRGQNETGGTVSQVSRSLRRYVTRAFELPPGEMTTSEFCRAAEANQRIGPEFAALLASFFRSCDEFKFAAAASPPGAVAGALQLVDLGEARLAQLRAAAPAQPA